VGLGGTLGVLGVLGRVFGFRLGGRSTFCWRQPSSWFFSASANGGGNARKPEPADQTMTERQHRIRKRTPFAP